MRNRAKCKLCQQIIESEYTHDFVRCSCGEIFVDGGQSYFRCGAKDFANFLRVDDEGNESPVVYSERTEEPTQAEKCSEKSYVLTRADHIACLDDMIKRLESLPDPAMQLPINQYDFLSFLLLMRETLKAES